MSWVDGHGDFVGYQSGSGFCSVSPARCAGSSLTCAKPATRLIPRGLACADLPKSSTMGVQLKLAPSRCGTWQRAGTAVKHRRSRSAPATDFQWDTDTLL